jgi:hypothetical protein
VKATPTVLDPSGFELPAADRRWLRWTIYIGYVALTAGIFHGLAQALSYANIDIRNSFRASRATTRASPPTASPTPSSSRSRSRTASCRS